MGFLDLVALLTRIPVPGGRGVEGAARSFHTIPVLGLLEGAVVAIAFMAGAYRSTLLGSALALVAHLLVTGGIHLDGLGDYADAVLPGFRGAEAYRVMKDPHAGSLAVAVVAVTLLARFASQTLLAPWAIILAYVLAAESLYIASLFSNPLGDGLGKLFVSEARARGLGDNIPWLLAALAASLGAAYLWGCQWCWLSSLLVSAPTALLASILVAMDSNERLGGVNGDVLGACFEISLTAATVVMSLA